MNEELQNKISHLGSEKTDQISQSLCSIVALKNSLKDLNLRIER